ncbi:MAG: protein kinase [Pseudomonadota bacterium]
MLAKIDGYTCEKEIARGGMSRVYQAIQHSLKRPVAIKFLSHQFSEHALIRQTFEQESLIIAQLSHPNIVQVFDRGITPDGTPYFVMELVMGETLNQFVSRTQASIKEKYRVIMDVLKAVNFAHNNGVIHRDLKPANILIDHHNTVKLLDFGIATFYEPEGLKEDYVVGTPDYMAPEQLEGSRSLDYRCDIYAVGVIMYELFTGELPKLHGQSVHSKNPSIPSNISEMVQGCLAQAPEQRPQSAVLLIDSLRTIMEGEQVSRQAKAENAKLGKKLNLQFKLIDELKTTKEESVLLYEDSTNHRFIVIKKYLSRYTREHQLEKLKTIQASGLAPILGHRQSGPYSLIIQPYFSGGSLWERMLQPCQGESFRQIALQLSEAMTMAHHHHLTHGALHPKHFALDAQGCIVIEGFGVAWRDFDRDPSLKLFHAHGGWTEQQEDIISMGKILGMLYWGRARAQESSLPIGPFSDVIDKMMCNKPGEGFKSFKEVTSALQAVVLHDEDDNPTEWRALVNHQTKKGSLSWWVLLFWLIGGAIVVTLLQLWIFFPEQLLN